MFHKFYEFNRSSIFYKMHENFLSMCVSIRMYQIACVSRRIETWKVWILTELSLRLIIINLHTITTYSSHNVENENENACPNILNILVTKGPKLARA